MNNLIGLGGYDDSSVQRLADQMCDRSMSKVSVDVRGKVKQVEMPNTR